MARNFESFLGANTPQGFVSFFDELYNPYENCSAYIIKGGPGTGKSTLMKKVLSECERRGITAEKIYCSSDPDSLDGIIVPDLGISIADGTSPHLLEPKFPGACENIINTGEFWDKSKLRERADEIRKVREEVSKELGVPTNLLSGATKEECEAQAKTVIASFKDWAKGNTYPNVKDGGEVQNKGTGGTRDQFANWFENINGGN